MPTSPKTKTPLQAAFVAFAVELAKVEIVDYIKAGHMPDTVATFADLHDHCDGNMLGHCGEFSEDTMDLIAPREPGEEDFMPQRFIDLVNEVQGAVDAWLGTGAHRPAEVAEAGTDYDFIATRPAAL